MRRNGIRRGLLLLTLALVMLAGGGPSWASVQRFVDEKGTIHITNHSSGNTGGKEAEKVRPGPVVRPKRPPAVPPEAPPPTETPPPMEKPPAPQPVSRYTDQRGVIHITNLAPAPRQLRETDVAAVQTPGGLEFLQEGGGGRMPATRAAAPRGAEASFSPKSGTAPANFPGPLGHLARRATKVSAGAVAEPPRGVVPERTAMSPAGTTGIRRFRDKRGVIHITNLAPGHPGGRPPPPVQTAALGGEPRFVPVTAGAGPPSPMLGNREAGRPPPGGRLMVRRDRQGRLVITNVMPKGPAHSLWARNGAANRSWLKPIVAEASQLYQLPVALIEALIKVESNFVPWAVSPKGAMGLMQLMPQTAAFLGVTDPFSPRENVLGGCRYFRLLLDHFQQSLPLALAAYNAGHQRVVAAGYQVPRIKETQAFVGMVLEHYYAGLEPALQPGL